MIWMVWLHRQICSLIILLRDIYISFRYFCTSYSLLFPCLYKWIFCICKWHHSNEEIFKEKNKTPSVLKFLLSEYIINVCYTCDYKRSSISANWSTLTQYRVYCVWRSAITILNWALNSVSINSVSDNGKTYLGIAPIFHKHYEQCFCSQSVNA